MGPYSSTSVLSCVSLKRAVGTRILYALDASRWFVPLSNKQHVVTRRLFPARHSCSPLACDFTVPCTEECNAPAHHNRAPSRAGNPLPSPREPLLSGTIHRPITHRSTPKMTRCLPRGLALGHPYVTQRVAAVQQCHVPNSNNKDDQDDVRPSKLFRRPCCKSLPARGLERA